MLEHGVSIRPARANDLVELFALFDRCSSETLYRRFLTGIAGSTDRAICREVERITSPTATDRSWVAVTPADTICGAASLVWGKPLAPPEMAVLVEDAWFRRGIGSALYTAMEVQARATPGTELIRATTRADNHRFLAFAGAVAPRARMAYAGGGEIEVVISLPTSCSHDVQDVRIPRACEAT